MAHHILTAATERAGNGRVTLQLRRLRCNLGSTYVFAGLKKQRWEGRMTERGSTSCEQFTFAGCKCREWSVKGYALNPVLS